MCITGFTSTLRSVVILTYLQFRRDNPVGWWVVMSCWISWDKGWGYSTRIIHFGEFVLVEGVANWINLMQNIALIFFSYTFGSIFGCKYQYFSLIFRMWYLSISWFRQSFPRNFKAIFVEYFFIFCYNSRVLLYLFTWNLMPFLSTLFTIS